MAAAEELLVPPALGREFESAAKVGAQSADIRGHKMARGGLEAACWDLEARLQGVPLWKQIGGGARREIPCGVSIGIQDSVAQLIEKIAARAGRRLPAHQDEDQAGLGRGRGPGGAPASFRRFC